MSLHLIRQVEQLKKQILALGALAEEAVAQAIDAVAHRDTALARRVIDNDEAIDQAEVDLEEECLHVLALNQPVAFDLRYIIATLKINSELERIGDLANTIAEQAIKLCEAGEIEAPFDFRRMSDLVRTAVKNSLDSLVNIDPDAAETVRKEDDYIDAIHRSTYDNVEKAIKADPQRVGQLLPYITLSRALERIGDHAVNVAEEVIYMARGDIMRHNRPHPLRDQASS